MHKNAKTVVASRGGMVGSALVRRLNRGGYKNLLLPEVTIAELAEVVVEVVGFTGRIRYDSTKPGGAPRKRLDNSRLESPGWKTRTSLRDGIAKACAAAPFAESEAELLVT